MVRVEPGGPLRRASATMAATLGDTVASSGIWAISLEGQGGGQMRRQARDVVGGFRAAWK